MTNAQYAALKLLDEEPIILSVPGAHALGTTRPGLSYPADEARFTLV